MNVSIYNKKSVEEVEIDIKGKAYSRKDVTSPS